MAAVRTTVREEVLNERGDRDSGGELRLSAARARLRPRDTDAKGSLVESAPGTRTAEERCSALCSEEESIAPLEKEHKSKLKLKLKLT